MCYLFRNKLDPCDYHRLLAGWGPGWGQGKCKGRKTPEPAVLGGSSSSPLFRSVLAPPTVDRRTLQTTQPTCLLFLPPASPEVGQSKKENEAGRRDSSLFFPLFQPP